MTAMTIATAPSNGDRSFNDGSRDGELAYTAGLTEARAVARAAMAEEHDAMYAAGYLDGYAFASVTAHLALDTAQDQR